MLPPVQALEKVSSSQVQLASGTGNRGTRTAAENIPTAPQNVQTPQQLERNAALLKVADILGSQDTNTADVITKLANEIARLIGQTRQPNELPQSFANRLADIILNLPQPAQAKLEQAMGFKPLGITTALFAAALKNPTSALAARIVALTENPSQDWALKALKAAISTYQQNGAVLPEAAAAQRQATDNSTRSPKAQKQANAAKSETAVENGSPFSGKDATTQKTAQMDIRQAPFTKAGNGQDKVNLPASTSLASGADNAEPAQTPVAKPQTTLAEAATLKTTVLKGESVQSRLPAPQQVQQNAAAKAEAPAPAQAEAEQASAKAASGETSAAAPKNGQHTMHALRGFNVVINTIASRAADAIKVLAEPPLPDQHAAQEAAGKSQKLATTTGVSDSSLLQTAVKPEEIAGKAHQAARAMEGKVIPLFTHASAGGDVGDVGDADAARIMRHAAQAASPAKPVINHDAAATAAGAAAAAAKMPEPIPFAQVPYPIEEERGNKAKQQRNPEQGENDNLPNDGGEEEAAMQNQTDSQDEQHKEPEIEEHPFDADEPLKRNATDAERAFHMYQRFGGF